MKKEADLSSFEEAYKQAEKEIPEKWYENEKAVKLLTLGVVLLALWNRISGTPSAPTLVGGAIYGIGAIADESTTMQVYSAHDKWLQKGGSELVQETDTDFSHIKTADDFRAAWKTRLAMEVSGIVASTIFPELGIAYTGGRLAAAMNNHRKAKRLEKAAEIVTNR